MKLSKSLLASAAAGVLADAVIALAQNQARDALAAQTFGGITDNSTGVDGGAFVPVVTPPTKFAATNPVSAVLSPRAGFNTAIGKADDAISVLAKYINDEVLTPLTFDTITLNASGAIAVAGTVPAMDKALAAVDGAAVKATATLTFTGLPLDTETVTINGKVYTFQDVLTNVDGHVKIGVSAATTLLNLVNAINLGSGTPGTDYAAATTVHPTVSAADGAGDTIDLSARTAGTAGNALTLDEAATNVAKSGATFAGGTNGSALLRSEAVLALSQLRNNLATVIKAYNMVATAVGVATVADLSGGKAAADLVLSNVTDAATACDGVGEDVAKDSEVDAALTALATNVAHLAAKITNPLLHASTTGARLPVHIVQ